MSINMNNSSLKKKKVSKNVTFEGGTRDYNDVVDDQERPREKEPELTVYDIIHDLHNQSEPVQIDYQEESKKKWEAEDLNDF